MNRSAGVLLLYNRPRAHARYAEADAGVEDEVAAVAAALAAAGRPFRRAAIRRLADVPAALRAGAEPLVFNLVERLDGPPADSSLVPAVCHALGRSCTGGDTPNLLLTLDKWQAKAALAAAGLTTPPGWVAPPGVARRAAPPPGRWIVKPLHSDASEGIDAASVVDAADPRGLDAAVRRAHRRTRQPALVEAYIEGRELNVSLLERGGRVLALPPAEIEFVRFPPGRPRIVDYAAKWRTASFEYCHTRRRVPARLPPPLARAVRRAARAAWRAVGCRDYARVDFRLDAAGRIFVLEVNANPDISPDAGLAAALRAAGMAYGDFVAGVLRNAARRSTGPGRRHRILP